jgi:hypothetical protein
VKRSYNINRDVLANQSHMRMFVVIALLVLLPLGLHSEVFTGEALNKPFTIHGRLHYYNGGGEMRIWIVGSKRILP